MNKYPLFLQDDPSLDGVSCIRMILKYYGIEEDRLMIRKKCRADRHGTSMKGLVEALSDYTIEASMREVSSAALAQQPLPCILLVKSDKRDHYVVLYEQAKIYYIVGDPQIGERHLSEDELVQIYAGRLIQITHLGRYYEYGNRTLFQDLQQWRKTQRRLLAPLSLLALITVLAIALIAGVVAWMADHLRLSVSWRYLDFLGLLVFLALTMITVSQKELEKAKIRLKQALRDHFVAKAVRRCVDADEWVYSKGETGVLSEMADMEPLSDYAMRSFIFCYYDLIIMALMVLILFYLHWPLALFSIAALIILLLLVYMRSMALRMLSTHVLKCQHDLRQKLYEYIHFRSLRFLMGSEGWQDRYDQIYQSASAHQQSNAQARGRVQAAVSFWFSGMLAINLICGFYFYYHHYLNKGGLTAYLIVLVMLLYHLSAWIEWLLKRPLALTLFEEFKELNSRELKGCQPFDEKITAITVNNLTYHYGSHEPVLNHFDAIFDHSLYIKGASGCGKTTLLRLLTGMDPVYHGNILINDKEISVIDRYDLAKHMIYLSGPLFIYGTVRENLMTDDEDVLPFLKVLGASYLQQHLDLIILPDGSPLSYRDQVLLMLARALAHHYDVYLLDGIFDHLHDDEYSEILNCLLAHFPEAIFLVVTSHEDERLDSCLIEAQDLHGG